MTNEKDRNYLINAYNATCTDDPPGSDELETYEAWLEKQLLARIERIEILEEKAERLQAGRDYLMQVEPRMLTVEH